jgi:hypothetical protein
MFKVGNRRTLAAPPITNFLPPVGPFTGINRLSISNKSATTTDGVSQFVEIGGINPAHKNFFPGLASDGIRNASFNEILNVSNQQQYIYSGDGNMTYGIIIWGNRLVNYNNTILTAIESVGNSLEDQFDGASGASGGGAGSDALSEDFNGGNGGSGTDGTPAQDDVYGVGLGYAQYWPLVTESYPIGGNGGDGINGGASFGGTGGLGGIGFGGGGGASGTDSQAEEGAMGGGGGGGLIVIIVNELIGNYFLNAKGGDSTVGSAKARASGGGGGGVILIAARRKQGTITADVSGGLSLGPNFAYDGMAGTIEVYAIRPDGTLEARSITDNWNYLTQT